MEKDLTKRNRGKVSRMWNPLVIRKGKYGEFTACSNYPECKYIKMKKNK